MQRRRPKTASDLIWCWQGLKTKPFLFSRRNTRPNFSPVPYLKVYHPSVHPGRRDESSIVLEVIPLTYCIVRTFYVSNWSTNESSSRSPSSQATAMSCCRNPPAPPPLLKCRAERRDHPQKSVITTLKETLQGNGTCSMTHYDARRISALNGPNRGPVTEIVNISRHFLGSRTPLQPDSRINQVGIRM